MGSVLAVKAWVVDHPLIALGLVASILGTLRNSLSRLPRVAAAVGVGADVATGLYRWVTDLTAVVAHADGRGLVGPFTLPGVPTLAKPTPKVGLTLLLLALSLNGCGWWRTHEAQLEADAATCGQMLAQGALEGLAQQIAGVAVQAADGQLGQVVVNDQLHQLAGAEIAAGIKAGIACVSLVVADLLKRPAPPPATLAAARSGAPMFPAIAYGHLQQWIAEHPAP